MLTTICFVIVNLTIAYILYSNYKQDITINAPFMVALYFTFVGNVTVEKPIYNINFYLSAINIFIAIIVNYSIYKKVNDRIRKENEYADARLKEMFEKMTEDEE